MVSIGLIDLIVFGIAIVLLFGLVYVLRGFDIRLTVDDCSHVILHAKKSTNMDVLSMSDLMLILVTEA